MVTGGAGFIGGHITEHLVSKGHEVVVFDNLSTGKLSNLDSVKDAVEVVTGDIRDISALETAAKGCDYIIHHAAEISTTKSVEDPAFVNEVNVGGTLNVLIAAKSNGAKRVVLASSSAIYGDTGKIKQDETMRPHPLSPYGASKIAGEHYCGVFHQVYGLETVCLRYFNVFGPRQNPFSQYAAVIPKFIDRLIKGQEIHIYGDGEQTRDFVFVKNIAVANYLACTTEGAGGAVCNIASDNNISVNDLVKRLFELSGKSVPVVYDPPNPGDIKFSAADITKAHEVLGFIPHISFQEGLEQTYDYYSYPAGR